MTTAAQAEVRRVIRRPWEGDAARAVGPVTFAVPLAVLTGRPTLLWLAVLAAAVGGWQAWWVRVELTDRQLVVHDQLWRRWAVDWDDVAYVGRRDEGLGDRVAVWAAGRRWKLPFPTVGTRRQRRERAARLEHEVSAWGWQRRGPDWAPRPEAVGWPPRYRFSDASALLLTVAAMVVVGGVLTYVDWV